MRGVPLIVFGINLPPRLRLGERTDFIDLLLWLHLPPFALVSSIQFSIKIYNYLCYTLKPPPCFLPLVLLQIIKPLDTHGLQQPV